MVRITAPDLRQAQKQSARIRAQFDDSDDRVAVLLDVIAHIAPEAHTARTEARWQPAAIDTTTGDTVLYIGTPRGLAGLILDIYAAGVADGVTVVPAVAEGDARDTCVQLLGDEVRTILATHSARSDVPIRRRAG
ncbi:hypothetical protein [Rhodococcus sp. B50]|uniref:hypothetical protein n=1 Tax=Rhodococcus sp. B50 TaxID=2682847 RepID=UPI001FD1A7A6|nr:hypothetical protein [Rhodococcus sp. B50]